jgi:hypothetical protein
MARGDDAGNLKLAVVVWVDELFGPSEPALKPNSKDERSLECDNTGRLLCPGEYNWEDLVWVDNVYAFGVRAEWYVRVRARIREFNGDYPVTANSWPIYLYAGYRCDMEDIEKGLFRSAILLKVRALCVCSYCI